MPPPFPQPEVRDIRPSSLVPIAHSIIPERPNVPIFDLSRQSVLATRHNSLSSLSIPQTDSTLLPNSLVSPASTFDPTSPSSPEDGPFSPLVGYSHTQSLDGALAFVSQVDGNCYDQSFMEYSSYSWGNTEWQNVNEIGSSDEYALSSIPAAEPGIPDYGQLSVPERSGDFCPPPLTATATINRSWNTLRTAGITLANHRTLL